MGVGQVSWLPTNKKHTPFNMAYPGFSLVEMVVPTEVLGSENVVGTLSVVPWARYGDWLSDLDMTLFFPEVGNEAVNANSRATIAWHVRPPTIHAGYCDYGYRWMAYHGGSRSGARLQRRTILPRPLGHGAQALRVCSVLLESGPGERWSPPGLVRGNRGADMQQWIHHTRRGFLFDQSSF